MNSREPSTLTQGFILNAHFIKLREHATNNFTKKPSVGFSNLVNFLKSEERLFGKQVNW